MHSISFQEDCLPRERLVKRRRRLSNCKNYYTTKDSTKQATVFEIAQKVPKSADLFN